MPSEFKLCRGATLTVEGDFAIYSGCHVSINPGARLSLGSGYINNDCTIDCFKEIAIGHDCAISKGVVMRDSDNHSIDGKSQCCAPISIGRNVSSGLRQLRYEISVAR
jgi:acetyltransferase-like isoleucine patch superfamily enzyme